MPPLICQEPLTAARMQELAEKAAPLVFRTDLAQPGFALVDLGTSLTSPRFRTLLLALARAMAQCYLDRFTQPLVFVSISQFDQQASTRPHRDGGPDASVLLLGYEPTEIASRIVLLDSTRAAQARGLSPAAFLDQYNPAFGGSEHLADHVTEITAFDSSRYQVLLVNNSVLPFSEHRRGMLGLLHQATILTPRPGQSRIINSVLMGLAPSGLSEQQLLDFERAAIPAV